MVANETKRKKATAAVNTEKTTPRSKYNRRFYSNANANDSGCKTHNSQMNVRVDTAKCNFQCSNSIRATATCGVDYLSSSSFFYSCRCCKERQKNSNRVQQHNVLSIPFHSLLYIFRLKCHFFTHIYHDNFIFCRHINTYHNVCICVYLHAIMVQILSILRNAINSARDDTNPSL